MDLLYLLYNINMGVIVYCISKVLYSIRSVLLYHIVYFFATYCINCTYCIFWPRCSTEDEQLTIFSDDDVLYGGLSINSMIIFRKFKV